MKYDPKPRLPLWFSFKCAGEGVWFAFRTQRNFRIHALATVIVALLAWWLRLPPLSAAVLALAITLVLVAELFNTAAEVFIDLVCPDYHPLAKEAKDLAAGAVLMVAAGAVIVGLLILGPPLWERFFG